MISRTKKIYILPMFFLGAVLIVLTSLRPIGIDADSLSYQEAYKLVQNGIFVINEPTFNFFSIISNAFFYDNKIGIGFLFFVYAGLSISIKFYAIYKYSSSIYLSILVYLCMFYILHEMTQIRVGLASAFFLLGIHDLILGNKKKYLIKIFAACLCHFSSLILLPLVFFSSERINLKIILLTPILMLCIILAIGDMNPILISIFQYLPEPLSSKAISYIVGVEQFGRFDSVNVFSKFTLSVFSFFILYIIACAKEKKIDSTDVIFLKLFSIMLTLFYFFSSVPVLASRIFELLAVSLILSFPEICKKFSPSWVVTLVVSFWTCLYCYLVNLKLIGM
ncbi:EpsG family protein [Escherichia albertii]|uniref:EpsG family protein n=1 Tax=Escherichia albertii TaxID=208962 RepID=UPI00236243C1|nr:EpsG family protein [Escherichia albertii]WDB75968.1 EpsG family protein [Escherichia albertii]